MPLGIIFSTFMVSIMLGSLLFRRHAAAAESALAAATLLYLGCHLTAALCGDQAAVCPFQRQVDSLGPELASNIFYCTKYFYWPAGLAGLHPAGGGAGCLLPRRGYTQERCPA